MHDDLYAVKLEAELASLKSELEKYRAHDKEVEEERRAMLYMLQDLNNATERLKREIDTTSHLLMIANATTATMDIDRLFDSVTRCTNSILGCDICLSFVWNRDLMVFKPVSASGLERRALPVFMTEDYAGDTELIKKAVENRKPEVCTTDSPEYDNKFGWAGEINQVAVIPLLGAIEPLGILICLYFSVPASIDELQDYRRDTELMQAIMNQVSSALEQARLYNDSINKEMELRHKIETIQVMSEIDRGILSAMAPDDIIEIATRMVSKIIPCDRTNVILTNRTNPDYLTISGIGVDLPAHLHSRDTSATKVLKTGRTQYVADLSEYGSLLPLEDDLLKQGFVSHLRVPLMEKGIVVGVLSVGSKKAAAFTSNHRITLEKLAAQIGVALKNATLITDLEDLFLGIVKSLSAAIDAKSSWTAGHSERVTEYALDIGRVMGLSDKELKDLELASLLHDIGKIGTYEYILEKPGKLTEEEQAIMRQHPVKGAEILSHIRQMEDIIPVIRGHQEYYNGGGYPDGLKGDNIPLMARIIGVADTADAMGADRPYRKGMKMEVITAELIRCSGTQFDPMVVDAFLKTLTGFLS